MKAAFHTLGCKVNQYETESLKERFAAAGCEISDENEAADVYVINTCTVTAESDRKSRQFIRRMKKRNPEALIVVCGCMAQVSPEALMEMPEVDIVAGTNEKRDLLEHIREYQGKRAYIRGRLTDYEDMGTVEAMENRTRAYIKIQDGCDRYCAYCVIPYARGGSRSRPASSVLKEAEKLIAAGYREIVLTGVNAALYGMEAGYVPDMEVPGDIRGIEMLIYLISRLPGDFRVRLSSLEPTVIDAAYVKRLLAYDKLCRSVHLSLQSGSDAVLGRMGRRYTAAEYLEIVDTLRSFDPDYGVSADVIAGFPGETDDDVVDTIQVIDSSLFLKTHIFPYSERKGTRACGMEGRIPPEIRKKRCVTLGKAASRASLKFLEGCLGEKRRVLFEEYDKDKNEIKGYTDNYIRVTVRGDENLLNEFAYVRITAVADGAAYGEIV